MKSDAQLERDVHTELDLESAVQTSQISVKALDGAVTLAGEVTSYTDKQCAERAARRVAGIRVLVVELCIQPAPTVRPRDADIASSIEVVLRCLSCVSEHSLTIAVEDGQITLGGTVDWQYQKRMVMSAIRPIPGAIGVIDRIALKPNAFNRDVKERIRAALQRRATPDTDTIVVDVRGGEVTLSGTIQS